MSKSLPELLDPRKAAAQSESYRGDLPLAGLSRLQSLVKTGQLDPDQGPGGGQAAYRLHFHRDASGRDVVEGSVRSQLRLRCQRCTEGFDLAVDADFKLALVAGLDEAEALPEQYDPLLIETPVIRPRDLIEDELILAVPAVPRHPEAACRAPATQAPSDTGTLRPSPFPALAQLRRAGAAADDED
jgi:uncharacterized protein